MKENKKKPREKSTIITVTPHYVGTESMSAVFERALLIALQQNLKQSDIYSLKNPPDESERFSDEENQ